MARLCPAPAGAACPGPRLEVADVLRRFGDAYRQSHALSGTERKVLDAIGACRTAALGGHVDVCQSCGHAVPAYNSCRNRHCPKCQSLAGARWIDARKQRLLPVHYFHVVFTLPAALRPLARRNPRRLYDLLFDAASQTLLELGRDPRRLGGLLGLTAVLHTWTRELDLHPHLHCIVTGGALVPDGTRFVCARGRYLLPVRVLGNLFRGKFLAALARLYQDNELDLGADCADLQEAAAFGRFKDALYRTDWVVYAKRPFGGPRQVLAYLGRYTHRTGLSNHRLKAISPRGIRFATRGSRSCVLAPDEFIRRFLLHVLPPRFVKIRHYGLLAPGQVATVLARARAVLRARLRPAPAEVACANPDAPAWQRLLLALTGVDLSRCPRCDTGLMRRFALAAPDTS